MGSTRQSSDWVAECSLAATIRNLLEGHDRFEVMRTDTDLVVQEARENDTITFVVRVETWR